VYEPLSPQAAEHYPRLGVQFRPIPKGLRPLAQGWIAGEKGAGGPTLGKPPTEPTNPERVAASRSDSQDHCRHPSRLAVACLALLAALGRVGASGAEASAWAEIEKNGAYPFITDQFKLYHNESNEVIQAFAINGVYQGQYWTVDAKQGNASGWENRRIYIGGSADFLHQINVQVMVKIGETFDPVYDGLHTAFLKWTPNQSVSLSLGRLDYFSFAGPEQGAASSRISTFEHGLLVNQLAPTEIVGALLQGKQGPFSGNVGLVSGSTTENFTDFAGGVGVLAGVSYDLPLFYDKGSLNLDYVFSNGNPSNNALKPYDNMLTLWHQGRIGPLGVGLQVIGANGLGARPAVFGVTAQAAWLFAQGRVPQG
jgi:hypothetical protein